LNKGYFFERGTLVDDVNTLTSDFGEYYTDTKDANFFFEVTLNGPNYTIISDTLKYNTDSKWAYVTGPSEIHNGANRIDTELGYYNTNLELAKLYKRSTLRGSNRVMTGDTIIYDKLSGDMFAYNNIDYHDQANKNILQGNYVWYNELTGSALVYDRALVKDYSSGPDTLYMHADTIKLTTYNLNTDSVSRIVEGYYHVRAYKTDVQSVCDSLSFDSQSRQLSLFKDPIVWSDNRQILGEQIDIHFNEQSVDSVYINRQALLVEQVDSIHFNQVSGHQMRAYFKDGNMHENIVEGNVRVIQYPMEKDSVVLYQLYMETAKLKMSLEQRKLQRIWTPASSGQFYGIGMAPREHSVLENFTWFDYIRPLHKDDLFEWRPKHKGTELKSTIRRQAPLQHF
jgi:lipopolysaccharide export system protein LptA